MLYVVRVVVCCVHHIRCCSCGLDEVITRSQNIIGHEEGVSFWARYMEADEPSGFTTARAWHSSRIEREFLDYYISNNAVRELPRLNERGTKEM